MLNVLAGMAVGFFCVSVFAMSVRALRNRVPINGRPVGSIVGPPERGQEPDAWIQDADWWKK